MTIVDYFNASFFSEMDRSKDKKINEYIDYLNKTMNVIDLMEIYRALPQQLDYKHYFQEQI